MSDVAPLRREVQFGIVSAHASAPRELQELCAELQKISLEPVVPRVLRTFPELADKMRDGTIGIAWMPPITAADAELSGHGAIMLSVWRGGGDGYSTAIFTLASSSITKLEDLRGKRMAWVDPQSAAGYVFPRLKLVTMGLRPDDLFADQTFYRTHEEVARAVFERRADAGATCIAYYPGTTKIQSAGWSKGNAYSNDAVRILATAGPIPPDAIVMSKGLDEARRKRLADALMRASVTHGSREIVTRLFSGEGFLHVTRTQYDSVRRMMVDSRRGGRAGGT